MHRCLAVNELLSLIFENLFLDRGSEDEELLEDVVAEEALANLAITCRSFTEPALNHLWRVQRVFANLVRCMPHDLWVQHGPRAVLTFRRALCQTDWDRFDFYARRIRQIGAPNLLEISDVTMVEVGEDVFIALATYQPIRVLLPNLLALYCMPWSWAALPYIQAFIGHQLTTFDLGVEAFFDEGRGRSDLSPNYLVSLFSALSHHSPMITSLSIGLNGLNRDVEEAFLTCVGSLKHLRDADIFIPDMEGEEELMACLANAPLLESLCADVTSASCHLYTTVHNRFQNLRILVAEFEGLQLVGRTLGAMQCQFDELRIRPSVPETTTNWQLPQLGQSLLVFRNHPCRLTLTVLELCPVELPTRDPEDDSKMSDILRPLFDLVNLQHVEIVMDQTVDLGDSWLTDASKAWPSLSHLTLASSSPSKPNLTLAAVGSLIQNCPDLRSFSLRVDATSNAGYPDDYGLCNYWITDIYIMGPIDCPEEVSRVLQRMLPNLERTISWDEGDSRSSLEELDKFENSWKKVDEILCAQYSGPPVQVP
ncbi:hypothetical protein Hypma_000521 [Hypsizygus marmoreus]|uniref:F-box domain-containing protein n=1 Tax=Hypsizygus marmoreus TaxID=39966 RepID=A0A369JAE7_HYPMA|nr:hypothetical protein Hypma_000521 [Hypsizygus marmoreus]